MKRISYKKGFTNNFDYVRYRTLFFWQALSYTTLSYTYDRNRRMSFFAFVATVIER